MTPRLALYVAIAAVAAIEADLFCRKAPHFYTLRARFLT